jgi:hypothetical protein
MRERRLAGCLMYSAFLLAVAPGCQALHRYRPVSIEAIDAETKKAIPGVEVKISYPLENSSSAPWESKGTTGPDGMARLKAAPYGRAGIMVEVNAVGYMSEQKYLSIQEVQAIEPAHWFEDVNRRPASFVMELFADPAPAIELLAPVGYRGQIKAKVQVQADLAHVAGQRLFRFAVPASGEVAAIGPPLFQHVAPSNFRVKFADDSPLTFWGKDAEIGYWFLKCEGTTYCFLVGTQRDYDDYRHSLQSSVERPSRGSGSSEGKGRKGRKGNSPPGDSSP